MLHLQRRTFHADTYDLVLCMLQIAQSAWAIANFFMQIFICDSQWNDCIIICEKLTVNEKSRGHTEVFNFPKEIR